MVSRKDNIEPKHGKHQSPAPDVEATQVMDSTSLEAEDTVFSQGAYSFDDVDRAEFGGA